MVETLCLLLKTISYMGIQVPKMFYIARKKRKVHEEYQPVFFIVFTIDSTLLTKDMSTEIQRRKHPRQNKVVLIQVSFPEDASELIDYQISANKALQNMDMKKRCI